MRAFQLGTRAGKTAFRSKHVSVSERFTFPTTSSIRIIQRRHQSSSEGVQWTQHSLSTSTAPEHEVSMAWEPVKKTLEIRTAYIALGSNLGDRLGFIEKACNEMSLRGIKIKRTSSLWETAAMYVTDQGNFLNGVCEVETTLSPDNLLNVLQSIENNLGRTKIIDKGPRNIDLDILLYSDWVVDQERLKIPHPLMYEREFVLRPLAELIPGKTLDAKSPWKVTQDYLNALPPSENPISTVTSLDRWIEPLRALQSSRQTRIMSVINLTPDSFSDGGVNLPTTNLDKDPESTLKDLHQLICNRRGEGASIFDLGGQSTAPHAQQVTEEEELARILPFLCYLHQPGKIRMRKKVAISIDTYRSSVIKALHEKVGPESFEIVNDISAGQMDPAMLSTVAELGKTVVLMHMRGTPSTMNKLTSYPSGLIPTIASELLERVAAAEAAGIYRWRIILDPGIGFAKTTDQNLEILRRLDELRDWPGLRGLPWLVGSSRKKFIGKITGVETPNQRTWGTAATVAAAVQGGADVVRVHDVRQMAEVVRMSDAIWRV